MRFASIVAALAASLAAAAPSFAQSLEVGAGAPVRIEIAHVEAAVEEGVARVEVDETFRNVTNAAQEGVYRFRLPEDAVIGSFSMWMDGKEKQARVLEAAQARAVYDSIVRKRKDPGLLEQTGWREFRMSVFPIPASGTVRVRLRYAHVVRDDLGLETLELPLPQGSGPVGDLRVHVTVNTAAGLAGIDSPSHADAVLKSDANGAEATWSGDGVSPTGPFVLRAIPKRDGFAVTVLAEHPAGAEEGWFVARVVPRLAEPPQIPRDVVFVLDRSGSMEGVKMSQARTALLRGLDTLKPGDRFDVISFSTDVTSLGDGALVPVDEEHLAAARRAARDLTASGGTNIGDALGAALARRTEDADRLFAVIFLTDGDPTVGQVNPDKILAAWREKSGGKARLFAFGVGRDVKDFLLTKLATEGRGDARYVREEETLEVKLAALFDRVRTPLLLDPAIDIDGDGVTVLDREPRRLPDLFQSRALVVSGRYTGSGKAVIHLRGRSGTNDVKLDVPIDLPAQTPDRPHVAQIWAKARVERLLDDMRVLGANAEIRADVLRLGLRHQLVTPYTSFLVVEDGVLVGGGEEEQNGPLNPDAVVIPDTDAAAPSQGGAFGRGGGGLGQAGGGRAGGAAPPIESAALARRPSWLQRHQSPDGHWHSDGFDAQCTSSKCDGPGEAGADVAATGLALLTFLGAGETHQSGPRRQTVRNGLKFLRDIQDSDGCFGPRTAPEHLRQHAIAAAAMTEAFGMTGSRVFRQPAERGVAFALGTRAANGTWTKPDGSLDVETTAWMSLLLRSAAVSGVGDVEAAGAALAKVGAALDELTDPKTGRVAASDTATAVATLLRLYSAHTPQNDPLLAKGAEVLVATPPKRGANDSAVDPTYCYFATLAMFRLGGEHWKAWSEAVRAEVIERQRKEPAGDEDGSWDPNGDRCGRVCVTALRLLSMGVYYRDPRVLGVR